MRLSNPQYITDNTGKKLSVVLPFKEYEWLIEEVEGKHSSSSPKSKGKASGLRGKLSPMTNEQIDQQLSDLENETGIKHEFEIYKGIWETATMFTSNTTEMTNHPAYQHIISLGKDVVPLLLKDMIQTSNHWFNALHKITGATPVPKEHQGKIQQMIKDWVQWAKDNNIDF